MLNDYTSQINNLGCACFRFYMMKIVPILILKIVLIHSCCLGQDVRVPPDTLGQIFYSVEAPLEPRDGMDAFFDRLTRHLKSSEELFADYLHFYINKDGKLYIEETSSAAAILKRFIGKEKNWGPGINSGPTKLTCMYVKLPIEIGKKTVYNRHIAYEEPYKSIDFGLYYSYVYPDFPYVDEIVSVINDNGQYSTPIVHKGKNVQDIISFLRDSKTRAQGSSTKTGRIYFYLLPK